MATELKHEQLEMPAPRRPPLRYHGSKWRIAPWIIDHLPKHRTYVEVFGGGASVLLRKPRSLFEVYNDLDRQVFGFFSILRSNPSELSRLVALTPFSRDEFDLSHEPGEDALESARRFVARCFFGYGTTAAAGFRSVNVSDRKNYANEWRGIPAALVETATRFQGVVIENVHYRQLIPKFDSQETVFYLDPPYPLSTRNSHCTGYTNEMTDADHRDLAWMLKSVKAKAIVSGYWCRLYDELYRDWRCAEKKTTANSQSMATRTEVLWMNF